jgi:hypothetical protein
MIKHREARPNAEMNAASAAREPTDARVVVPLKTRDGSVREFAVVDEADWERLAGFGLGEGDEEVTEWHQPDAQRGWTWFLFNGYAARRAEGAWGSGPHIRMHRWLCDLGPEDDDLVPDHKDRNRLNNTRANLEVVTKAENAQNRPSRLGSSSRFRGVSVSGKRWSASVTVSGKTFRRSCATELEALFAVLELQDEHTTHARNERVWEEAHELAYLRAWRTLEATGNRARLSYFKRGRLVPEPPCLDALVSLARHRGSPRSGVLARGKWVPLGA